ncbi:MAG: chlorophyll synthase ChlG [Pseudomonadota bacterium]
MSDASLQRLEHHPPLWLSGLELLKPVTWFPPMWAFACGVVASGVSISARWQFLVGGVLLAGPFLCGTSQVVNDWFDRHVDALNQPDRPIPSGRIPGRWGLYLAVIWSVLSMLVASLLGQWVFAASSVGLLLAWVYSAPPLRLKRNGWFGNAAVGICYESLPWFTAVAAMTGLQPDLRNVLVLLCYGFGAHGIMTLNDFKSIDGDRAMGLKSIPALYGPANAARLACVMMALPQAVVITLLWQWQLPGYALGVGIVLLGQCMLMPRLLSNPLRYAPWYNATGIALYVSGMMISAFALRGLIA